MSTITPSIRTHKSSGAECRHEDTGGIGAGGARAPNSNQLDHGNCRGKKGSEAAVAVIRLYDSAKLYKFHIFSHTKTAQTF